MMRWASCLVFLQMLDVFTTMLGLAHGAVEANPLGRLVLAAGPWGLLGIKLLATAGMILVAAWTHRRGVAGRRWAVAFMAWPCVVMACVVAWNVSRVVHHAGA